MKKILLASFLVSVMFGATSVYAEVGGTITKTTNQPSLINEPSAYQKAVNSIVTSFLQIFDWKSADGTLAFTATGYSIKNNCNTLFGTYKINKSTIELSLPASTMMACENKYMEEDQKLAKTLEQVKMINFINGELVLSGSNDSLKLKPVIEFDKK